MSAFLVVLSSFSFKISISVISSPRSGDASSFMLSQACCANLLHSACLSMRVCRLSSCCRFESWRSSASATHSQLGFSHHVIKSSTCLLYTCLTAGNQRVTSLGISSYATACGWLYISSRRAQSSSVWCLRLLNHNGHISGKMLLALGALNICAISMALSIRPAAGSRHVVAGIMFVVVFMAFRCNKIGLFGSRFVFCQHFNPPFLQSKWAQACIRCRRSQSEGVGINVPV